ncbi:SDR family NAD(P)-dependent oxidoreductase [Nostoc sp. CHAB 5715]|uniref:SDR family NAD(P)-dependent oxidoreductase n=1 Tax=Nostoc sp. CHAB 5715 TaxID=2780400 RepID=UPI001E53E980|nr:SDR family oxidoreductase [Nostoc sp. CHAB 5715]MCC5622298.1 SDR family oxidoreductase [Nostoc sp. CHAB 5715]
MSQQQVILISGGSRGLGSALVSNFLELGHIVATFSRSCTPFIEELHSRNLDQSFLWESIDGTDYEQVKQFVMSIAKRYGRLDVLINNAGVGVDGILALMRASDIHQGIALNLEGSIHLIQACSRIMLQQQTGSIINISSVNAVRGHAGVAVYSATKAALDGLTRSLARELGPRGIRVNSVAPGYFESTMVETLTTEQRNRIIRRTPLGRLGTINDMVGAIQFLLSPNAQFITGQTLVIDGGITC